MKYVAFDIEVATLAPDFEDPNPNYKLGVTCVGLHVVDEGRIFDHVLYGTENQDDELDVMTAEQCWHVIKELARAASKGYTVVSFNGLKFDFRVLAAEITSGRFEPGFITDLALRHYDIGFHMVCEKGFMSKLQSLAEASIGLSKTMDGVAAVEMWNGGREAQDRVIEYVTQDALVTGRLYEALVKDGYLEWVSQKGRRCTWRPRNPAPLRVCEANELPLPIMDWAWDRESFIGWAEKGIA